MAIVAGDYPGKDKNWTELWQGWPEIQAVIAGHLFTVPADLLERQTPRALRAVRQLCERIDRIR